MSHAFELEFQTDFQEQIIHAIRDHIDHYDQQNISFIIADYLTIQNQKATNAKIAPIQAKVEELEASWNRILTKDIGYTLDKWKKIFIELAKNRAILQALQEKNLKMMMKILRESANVMKKYVKLQRKRNVMNTLNG